MCIKYTYIIIYMHICVCVPFCWCISHHIYVCQWPLAPPALDWGADWSAGTSWMSLWIKDRSDLLFPYFWLVQIVQWISTNVVQIWLEPTGTSKKMPTFLLCPSHLEVSWNRATPSRHHPFSIGISPEMSWNKPSGYWGYPHDYGNCQLPPWPFDLPRLGLTGCIQPPPA